MNKKIILIAAAAIVLKIIADRAVVKEVERELERRVKFSVNAIAGTKYRA